MTEIALMAATSSGRNSPTKAVTVSPDSHCSLTGYVEFVGAGPAMLTGQIGQGLQLGRVGLHAELLGVA